MESQPMTVARLMEILGGADPQALVYVLPPNTGMGEAQVIVDWRGFWDGHKGIDAARAVALHTAPEREAR